MTGNLILNMLKPDDNTRSMDVTTELLVTVYLALSHGNFKRNQNGGLKIHVDRKHDGTMLLT